MEDETKSVGSPPADDATQTRGSPPASPERPARRSSGAAQGAEHLERIGPYIVLEPLGSGGMGSVYAAYHRELDRKVALKLIKEGLDTDEENRTRLQREAQAMARLDHPNVVGVHDVGQHDNRVYLVMDLVEGQTLKEWLAERPRPWREVLAMFIQAGRGLAAAHAAGMIHRDFKPSNVLIGRDGRPRVTDFGLARDAGAIDPVPARAESSSSEKENTSDADPTGSRSGLLSQSLTEVGAILGTPRYMAPEQYVGRGDAATDQFSFCVALYEALYGDAPFRKGAVAAYGASGGHRSSLRLVVNEPPKGASVPRFVRKALVRGLAGDPADRFGSMEALLAELAKDPAKQLAVGAAALAGLAMLSTIGILTYGLFHPPPAEGCDRPGGEWTGIWDASARSALAAAFHGASLDSEGLDFAKYLDGYTGEWTAIHQKTCARSAARRPAPEVAETLICLGRQKTRLETLLSVLAHATEKQLAQAQDATDDLVTPNRCEDPRVLSSLPKLPLDPEKRRRIQQLELAVDQARVEARLDPKGALPTLKSLIQQVREVGYRPLEADALMALDGAMANTGDSVAEVIKTTIEAEIATEAAGQDAMSAKAAANLAFELALLADRPEEAGQWLDRSRARLERVGGDSTAEAALELSAAAIAWRDNRYSEALGHFHRVLDLLRASPGTSNRKLIAAITNIAILESSESPADEAEQQVEEALTFIERSVGVGASYGQLLGRLAVAHQRAGHFAAAEEALRRSEALRAKLNGGAIWAFYIVFFRAELLRAEGKSAQALREAEAGFKDAQALSPSERGAAKGELGVLLESCGRHAEAKNQLQPIVDGYLAGTYRSEFIGGFLTALAAADIALHQPQLALPLLERERALQRDRRPGPGDRAELNLLTARALIATDGDRAEAAQDARLASEEFGRYPWLKGRLEESEALRRRLGSLE